MLKIDYIKKLNIDDLVAYFGDDLYSIFRFSLTKKEFKRKLKEWLNEEVEKTAE